MNDILNEEEKRKKGIKELKGSLSKYANPKLIEREKSIFSGKDSSLFIRELGGSEDGFYMSPDFDDTPDCFKEYM